MTRQKKPTKRWRHCRRVVKKWLVNYGFAALVLVALGGGVLAALNVEVPTQDDGLPSLAFGSELLYKLEIGGLTFLFGYLVVLAFVLALNGRGFVHIGPKGLKAEEVVNRAIHNQDHNIAAVARGVKRNRAVAGVHNAAIKDLIQKASSSQETETKILAILRLQQEGLEEIRNRLDRLEENDG